eukprot:scaffold133824_cov32-Tisochrysis_lutea.AAC.1
MTDTRARSKRSRGAGKLARNTTRADMRTKAEHEPMECKETLRATGERGCIHNPPVALQFLQVLDHAKGRPRPFYAGTVGLQASALALVYLKGPAAERVPWDPSTQTGRAAGRTPWQSGWAGGAHWSGHTRTAASAPETNQREGGRRRLGRASHQHRLPPPTTAAAATGRRSVVLRIRSGRGVPTGPERGGDRLQQEHKGEGEREAECNCRCGRSACGRMGRVADLRLARLLCGVDGDEV